MRRGAALAVALGLVLALAPAASALSVRASAREPGRIALRVEARPGVALTLRD